MYHSTYPIANCPSIEFPAGKSVECSSSPVEAIENTFLRRSTRVSNPPQRLTEENVVQSFETVRCDFQVVVFSLGGRSVTYTWVSSYLSMQAE